MTLRTKPRKTTLLFAALGAAFFSILLSLPASAEPPKNFNAVYKARYMGVGVTARRVLETLEDGSQKLTFTADSWLADLVESSRFRWSEDFRVIPLVYTYERSGLGRDREATVKFDWDNLQVTNNVQRKPWVMDVPEFALDKLSYQLQIRADLINAKPLLQYDIADGGYLKTYHFEVLGEETLKTPAGAFTTVKVKRVREESEERQTIFWMAKDWDYLVVRLQQQEDDGNSYEIDLHEATVDGEEVRGD